MGASSSAKVAVIGGSLVGPAAELFLRRIGFANVTTYEAMPEARSQSGGVMGLRYQVLDLLAGVGVNVEDLVALGDNHTYAFDRDRQRGLSDFPGIVASWQNLHDQFRRLVDVKTRKRVTTMTEVGSGWLLDFSDGSTAEADVVIGADGRNSFLRKVLAPERPLRYNGYVVWRGLAEPPAPTPHGFERHYDTYHGRLFSVTEPIRQTGKSYWELSHNLPDVEYARAVGGGPTEIAFMLPGKGNKDALGEIVGRAARHLPDAHKDMIASSEIAGIPVNELPFPKQAAYFRRGGATAVLVGDALHPVRLQVGAGLNQGLLQVAELAAALVSADRVGSLMDWQHTALDRLAPIVELGRSRAHRNNLGTYEPVRPGYTAAPDRDAWSEPHWVIA